MGLTVYLKASDTSETVYRNNITHNVGKMADAVGLYDVCWRPEEIGITHARQLIEPLREGLRKLVEYPAAYIGYDHPHGWGTYDNFTVWVRAYLVACEEHPDAVVEVCT